MHAHAHTHTRARLMHAHTHTHIYTQFHRCHQPSCHIHDAGLSSVTQALISPLFVLAFVGIPPCRSPPEMSRLHRPHISSISVNNPNYNIMAPPALFAQDTRGFFLWFYAILFFSFLLYLSSLQRVPEHNLTFGTDVIRGFFFRQKVLFYLFCSYRGLSFVFFETDSTDF